MNGNGEVMTTTPFTMIENGTPVVCYPVTFDDRKITVHTPEGPRTRTRRNCGGYATAAMLHAIGYTGLCASTPDGSDDMTFFVMARD